MGFHAQRQFQLKMSFFAQLQKTQRCVLTTTNNELVSVDYYLFSDPTFSKKELIVLLPGFGSGWTGISELAFYLADLGHAVCMISLPGYGNSDDLPLPYEGEKEEFTFEAEIIKKFLEVNFKDQKIHLVGHSMGALIGKILTYKNRFSRTLKIRTLTLLSPVGFKKRNKFLLSFNFMLNGILHRVAHRDDLLWKNMSQLLPKERSAFELKRLKQRWFELKKCCGDLGIFYPTGILPVAYIVGGKDSVVPYDEFFLTGLANDTIQRFKIENLFHNLTMYSSDVTATLIAAFIEEHKEPM